MLELRNRCVYFTDYLRRKCFSDECPLTFKPGSHRHRPQNMIGWANKGQQSSKFWSKRPDSGSSMHFLPRTNTKNPAVSTGISNFVDLCCPIVIRILSCGGVNRVLVEASDLGSITVHSKVADLFSNEADLISMLIDFAVSWTDQH